MAEEEKDNNTTISSDDLDVLRAVLHNVKGISPVSSVTDYSTTTDSDQE